MKTLLNYEEISTSTSFCTLLSACESEDIQREEQLLPLKKEQGRQIFDISDFKNPYVRDKLKINLNKSPLSSDDQFEEYDTNLHAELENSYNTIFEKYHILSLQDPRKGEDKNILIKFISSVKLDGVTLTKMEETNFTGTVIYYNRLGEATKTEVYENGKESTRMKNYLINNSVKSAPADACINCYVLMYTIHWTDWYNGYTMEYTHSEYQNTTSEWVYVGSPEYQPMPESGEPYHNHYDYPHGPSINRNNHEIEILTNENFDGTTAECVYKKLVENSINFSEAIKKFDGDFPVSHLKLSMVSDIPNDTQGAITTALTLPPVDYITEIQFNEKYFNLNYSDITYARTIIHEVIHAEMYRKLLSLSKTSDLTINSTVINELKDDFPGMFDYYSRYFYDEYLEAYYNDELDAKKMEYFSKIGNDWQHELMGAHYVDIMASTLYEFSGGAYTIKECEKFALGSLKGTVAWDAVKNEEDLEIFLNNVMNNGLKNCN